MFAVPSIAAPGSSAAQPEKQVAAATDVTTDEQAADAPLHSVAGIVPTLQ
jgi:hypothetical protein